MKSIAVKATLNWYVTSNPNTEKVLLRRELSGFILLTVSTIHNLNPINNSSKLRINVVLFLMLESRELENIPISKVRISLDLLSLLMLIA
jgi:hypothetical protein